MSESSSEHSRPTPEVPLNNNSQTVLEVINSYSESEIGNDPIILINPGNGHGTYVLANDIINETNAHLKEKGIKPARILMPLLMGDTQQTILREINEQNPELVLYDEQMGNMIHDIYFKNGTFSDHLKQVITHYEDVQRMVDQRLGAESGAFSTRSLATDQEVMVDPRNIVATIDAGTKVLMRAPERYFAFPYLVAGLLQEAYSEQEAAGGESIGLSQADLKKNIELMLKIESGYSKAFVPYINPLSYKYADNLEDQPATVAGQEITYTPGMTAVTERLPMGVPNKAAFATFSGTGMGQAQLSSLVQAAKESGLDVYTPGSTNIPGAIKGQHDIFKDPNIVAWFARPGWGGLWKANALGIPWGALPTELGEDPEIVFNNRTLEALRLGKIINNGEITPQTLDELQLLSPGIATINEHVEKRFGTKNGCAYIGRMIGEQLLNRQRISG